MKVCIVGGLVILLLLASCSSSDDDASPDYYQQLQTEITSYQDAVANQASRYEVITTLATPEDVQEESIQLWLDDMPGVYSNARQRIAALSPPRELEASHGDMINALASLDTFFSTVREDSDPHDLLEPGVLEELLNDPQFTSAADAFNDACHEAQEIIDATDAPLDLGCPGAPSTP